MKAFVRVVQNIILLKGGISEKKRGCVSEGDLLLVPALRCQQLMDSNGIQPSETGLCSELVFWLDELQACVAFATAKMNGLLSHENISLYRMQTNVGETMAINFKGTFLNFDNFEDEVTSHKRRSKSAPPSRCFSSTCVKVAGHDGVMKSPTKKAVTPEAALSMHAGSDARAKAHAGITDNSASSLTVRKTLQVANSPMSSYPSRQGTDWQMGNSQKVKSNQSKKIITSKATGLSSRWWMSSNLVCPVSDFPIRLLPYPPLSLENGQFVDAWYLVLQVIFSWRFEAAGRPLTDSDIEELDGHVKRCKLGSFRIHKAIVQFVDGGVNSLEKFGALRMTAGKKLLRLKDIQTARRLAAGVRV